jgi:hypothetical protein
MRRFETVFDLLLRRSFTGMKKIFHGARKVAKLEGAEA